MAKKYRNFTEYLNRNGKLDTPKVDASGDTAPEGDKSPAPAATKGKNWEAQVKSDKPKPYKPTETPVPQEWPKKYEKGLGNDGDKKLEYKPDTPKDFGNGGKKVASWPKTTTEFLQTTKGMKIAELAAFIKSHNKNIDSPLPEDPLQATYYVAALANTNDSIMETMVREMKRLGCLDRLMAEVMKQPEAYSEMATLMSDEDGLGVCRRLIRAIESVDAPASETEIGKTKKIGPAAKTRKPKSIDGEKFDGGDGVEASKTSLKPEHNLIKAIIGNKNLVEQILKENDIDFLSQPYTPRQTTKPEQETERLINVMQFMKRYRNELQTLMNQNQHSVNPQPSDIIIRNITEVLRLSPYFKEFQQYMQKLRYMPQDYKKQKYELEYIDKILERMQIDTQAQQKRHLGG